jgi:RNA polymerase sigma-70 factor (ECF subfamily)
MTNIDAKSQKSVIFQEAVQEHLGEHLRSLYADALNADISRDLSHLIERLNKALAARTHPPDPVFINDVLKCVPNLRSYAMSLVRNADRAEDLVQMTLLKACDKHEQFQPGTNLNAWLSTILRNQFHSEYRKTSREVEDGDGIHAASLITIPDQMAKLELQDLWGALSKLQPDQREALLLVGAEGLSYDEAAAVVGVAVGTVKSRVNRARNRLAELLGLHEEDLAGTKFSHT